LGEESDFIGLKYWFILC